MHGPLANVTASNCLCDLVPYSHTCVEKKPKKKTNEYLDATHDTDDFYHVPVSAFLVFLSRVMMPR